MFDPYDVYLLCKNLKQSFEKLLSYTVELQVAEGIILPNLKMSGTEEAYSLQMNREDVPFWISHLGFAVCFLLEEFMKTMIFNISSDKGMSSRTKDKGENPEMAWNRRYS